MEKLKIIGSVKSKDTITRTIRISGEVYYKVNSLAEENKISFNAVINKILEYGLNNLAE